MDNKEPNKTNAIQVKMAQYKPITAVERYDSKGWIGYGPDNLYPSYLIDIYESAPVHGALTTSIIEMISGAGFLVNQKVEQYNLNSIIDDIAYDVKIQGGFILEIRSAIEGNEPAAIEHLPFENCRIGFVENGDGLQIFTGVWYSKDWTRANKKGYKPRFIPNYQRNSDALNQCFVHFGKLTKSRAYPKPDYEKSLTWIEVEKQIGIYHMNNLMNGLFPAFMIHMMNGQKDPEEAQQIKRDFEKQLGTENAGGFMMTFNEADKDSPKVDLFPLSDADKQYEFLSKESTMKIMIGHRVTSPLLFGIRGEGGGLGSNKDEMLMGYKLFMSQVIVPFQKFICDGFTELFKEIGVEQAFEIVPNKFILEEEVAVAPVAQTLEEKKKPELTKENEVLWTEFLMDLGEKANADWIEIDSWEVDYKEEDADEVKMSISTGSARPNSESEQDKRIDGVLYITRYRYAGGIQDNTRPFCRKMLEAAKLYRKEDVMQMKEKAVNPGWGPRGADTYSIWLYKGGGNCHHVWEKVVYVSAKDLGIDVNSPKAKEIAVSKAAEAGYKTRNTPKVAQRPIDMPYNGFLPPEN